MTIEMVLSENVTSMYSVCVIPLKPIEYESVSISVWNMFIDYVVILLESTHPACDSYV